MTKLKNIFKVVIALCLTTLFHSCSLDEYNPSMISGDERLATFVGWKGMQSYCYQPLSGYLFNYEYFSLTEGGTDEWLTANNRTWAQEVYYYEGLTTNTNYIKPVFKYAYSAINSCNTVIDRAAKVTDGNKADIKVLTAETKCLRGFYYLVLVTQFGPITLNTTEATTINTRPKRNTIQEIYTQIISDLKSAADSLGVTPYGNNYGRCTKKTALGLLARAYAQGAGEGLTENGVSYWQRAKEVAEDMITNAASYGAYLYPDVSDVWAQANNRASVNKEYLFTATGPDANDPSYILSSKQSSIFSYVMPNPYKLSDIYKTQDKSNYFYGRVNNNILAPSKYLINCFDATNDKRWENSFAFAYGDFSAVAGGAISNISYASKTVSLSSALCTKYGINPAFSTRKIYPYADITAITPTTTAGNQYPAKIWPKGEHSGDPTKAISVKNVYVTPYPIDVDDDRFAIYLSKDYLSAADKALRPYVCINIDDLFDASGNYKTTSIDATGTNTYMIYPGLIKYNWNYNGAFNGTNLQSKLGDIAIMRMAEVYLIAAEANQMLGDGAKAATYLNVLRKRAYRGDPATFDSSPMKLTNATENDVLDEYARELCGEFERWPLLKRHHDFETRLASYNVRAAAAFTAKNYLRPISYEFLSQIDNADEYGTNGY